MLRDLLLRVHTKFVAKLGEKLLDWAYSWLRGDGGSFTKYQGKIERLLAGMRLVEVADSIIQLLRRAEVLQVGHNMHFSRLLDLANKTFGEREVYFICF